MPTLPEASSKPGRHTAGRWAAPLLLTLVAIAALTWTPAVAAEDDFQVNTYTTGDQGFASVSVDSDGGFVVVWQSFSSSGTDTSFSSVLGQRYAADGSPSGGEFQVNTYTTGPQGRPSVSVKPDGLFVVVWESSGSAGSDTSGYSVQGRRYASDGAPVGGQFQVNTYTTTAQRRPSVSVEADGDFVVVWESDGSSGTDSSESVQGQRYASDGSPNGGEFQVNTYPTSTQARPSVSVDADGDFVVVWYSEALPGTSSIQGQRYASDGSPNGGEFQINTFTGSGGFEPSMSMDSDGDFVVVWTSSESGGTDTSDWSIQGQRYASDGFPSGGQFQVNSYTPSLQRYPAVSTGPGGEFVAVFTSFKSQGTDGSDYSVQAQRFAANGSPIGGQFQVNAYITYLQFRPSVSMGPDRDFVVVWDSSGSAGTDNSNYSVQGRRIPAPVFTDGFESGNVSAWSSSAP